jgi:hypothetical protein
MITDSNREYFAKMLGRGLQEEVNEATVQYVEGGFGPPKTEGFLPNVNPWGKSEMNSI